MRKKLFIQTIAIVAGSLLVFAGTASAYPVYPKKLTNKEWQKKKGKIAKVAGKTGIGAAMKRSKALYKQVDWKVFDPYMALSKEQRTVENIDALYKEARKEYAGKVQPLRESVKELRDLAEDVAKKWKKKKTIPKKSRKYVASIAKEADRFFIELKSFDDADFKKMKSVVMKREAKAVKGFKDASKSIEDGLKKVKKTPTVKVCKAEMFQPLRAMGAAIGDSKLRKQWLARWGKISLEKYFPDQDSEVKDFRKKVKKELKALESDWKAAYH